MVCLLILVCFISCFLDYRYEESDYSPATYGNEFRDRLVYKGLKTILKWSKRNDSVNILLDVVSMNDQKRETVSTHRTAAAGEEVGKLF